MKECRCHWRDFLSIPVHLNPLSLGNLPTWDNKNMTPLFPKQIKRFSCNGAFRAIKVLNILHHIISFHISLYMHYFSRCFWYSHIMKWVFHKQWEILRGTEGDADIAKSTRFCSELLGLQVVGWMVLGVIQPGKGPVLDHTEKRGVYVLLKLWSWHCNKLRLPLLHIIQFDEGLYNGGHF